jgi:hypothetical protein
MSIGSFVRSTTPFAALALLAASVACGSSAPEPTGSSAQASRSSVTCWPFHYGSVDNRLSCVVMQLDQAGMADLGCPISTGYRPAGMEACTTSLWVPWLGDWGGEFWVCPDSLEGSLPSGTAVGAAVSDVCASGSFFAYQLDPCPYLGQPDAEGKCYPVPGTGCHGGCISPIPGLITGDGP